MAERVLGYRRGGPCDPQCGQPAGSGTRLVVGADGVSLVRARATTTVRAGKCAALPQWPDGARQFIGRDGATIRVEPTLWRLKNQARQLDVMVPADRLVTMPYHPDGTISAALLIFGLILGASAAQFARARLLTRAAQQNARRY